MALGVVTLARADERRAADAAGQLRVRLRAVEPRTAACARRRRRAGGWCPPVWSAASSRRCSAPAGRSTRSTWPRASPTPRGCARASAR
ncbi:MAG: hypothetical protein MZW92_41000 [Comamonadaceae bacterium]|nr:hypothetical protein [Comamonadaceae bacterium]